MKRIIFIFAFLLGIAGAHAALEPSPAQWESGELILLALDHEIRYSDESLKPAAEILADQFSVWSGDKCGVEFGVPPADHDYVASLALNLSLTSDSYHILGNRIEGGSVESAAAGVQIFLQWLATSDAEWLGSLVEYPLLDASGTIPSKRTFSALSALPDREAAVWRRLLYSASSEGPETAVGPEKTEQYWNLLLDRRTRRHCGDPIDWGSSEDAIMVNMKGVNFMLDAPCTLGEWPEEQSVHENSFAIDFPARQIHTFAFWHESGAALPQNTPVVWLTVHYEDGSTTEHAFSYGRDLAEVGAMPAQLAAESWRSEGFVTEWENPEPEKAVIGIRLVLAPEAVKSGYRLNALSTW